MFTRRSRTVLLACVTLMALLSAPATGRSAHVVNRPNILLITVDSLRADALGVYDYRGQTSPRIDAFARESVVISDGFAQAPYTKASIASLMTGLFPGAHKTYTVTAPGDSILENGGRVKQGHYAATDALPDTLTTLAEALHAAGYRTVGLNTNPFLIREFGFSQGFDDFRFFGEGKTYARAHRVLGEALRIFRDAGSQPLFTWIHLMDTHDPYTPSEPYRAMFPPQQPPRVIDAAAFPVPIEGSADVNLYRARYDACVREADAEIGLFLAELRAAKSWDRTAVVLTADHGEAFLEHGRMGHNTQLFDEQLHVPLILRIPGLKPVRLRATAQLLDLYPTLIHLGTGHVPLSHGSDLLPQLLGTSPGERYAFAELPGRLWMVRSREWKLISKVGEAGKLFCLATDPGEQKNLAAVEPSRAADLRRKLAAAVAVEARDGAAVGQRMTPIDPRVLEQLRALGYLSGHP